ncbi:MAG: beta-Ala-His dipeptidase [Candidatus Heimdallarchaeota archaeon]|nr:MAG: beta-Ala-His dipeptidase [Candidatus Heimdallarchaeota archaeon]
MEKRILEKLEPQIVWRMFEDISRIPRESKKEEKIRAWVKAWADKHQISWEEDSIGNLLLSVAASKGYENYPGIILQGHLDMVAQKIPESSHDFDNDPIPIKIEDDYVTAEGTTLGADNGIGVAMALTAISDPDLNHGPIDVLLTVDEETGLTGAFGLEKIFFKYKYLLNLDSEKEGEITVSSAGGGDTKITISTKWENKPSLTGFRLSVGGLRGGHSGVDIHKPRLNAIKVLVEGLINLRQKVDYDFHISTINGGSAHNAIPRDAYCEFLVDNDEAVRQMFDEWGKQIESYRKDESNIKAEMYETSQNTCLTSTNSILTLLYEIPHGALTFSKIIPELVETSNNLALVKTLPDSVEIVTSTRSSIDSELNRIRSELVEIGERIAVEVTLGPLYPGWQPELDSPFLNLVKQEYNQVYGSEVQLKAIHAGLETGLFKGIDPELQLVSIGPEIKDVHSPQERVYIKSVDLIWRIVKGILTNLDQI